VFALHNEYFNATPFGNSDPPDTTYVHPYEYIRVFSTFNQNRRGIRTFTGTLYGLGADWPDIIHKYFITDPDFDSNNRRFMALSMEWDWRSCRISQVVLAETFHTDGKIYSDPFTFKYIN
jgi:hypothetical protein